LQTPQTVAANESKGAGKCGQIYGGAIPEYRILANHFAKMK
jgi:hypothetical protein